MCGFLQVDSKDYEGPVDVRKQAGVRSAGIPDAMVRSQVRCCSATAGGQRLPGLGQYSKKV
jgi:hypothetical protein